MADADRRGKIDAIAFALRSELPPAEPGADAAKRDHDLRQRAKAILEAMEKGTPLADPPA